MIASLTGQGINVQQACVTLGVSPSGYYAWNDPPDAPDLALLRTGEFR